MSGLIFIEWVLVVTLGVSGKHRVIALSGLRVDFCFQMR